MLAAAHGAVGVASIGSSGHPLRQPHGRGGCRIVDGWREALWAWAPPRGQFQRQHSCSCCGKRLRAAAQFDGQILFSSMVVAHWLSCLFRAMPCGIHWFALCPALLPHTLLDGFQCSSHNGQNFSLPHCHSFPSHFSVGLPPKAEAAFLPSPATPTAHLPPSTPEVPRACCPPLFKCGYMARWFVPPKPHVGVPVV